MKQNMEKSAKERYKVACDSNKYNVLKKYKNIN